MHVNKDVNLSLPAPSTMGGDCCLDIAKNIIEDEPGTPAN